MTEDPFQSSDFSQEQQTLLTVAKITCRHSFSVQRNHFSKDSA